ncbi:MULTISPECIES: hypothetical protein [unclassified Pseudomonas]|uniref:hypothetical protein n=1 Tax=unclassified Pseudomonas TaxID=196821 RepID=UPI0016215A93|nr:MULTISPECIES: hypothetical protein [unclassified Pseudomonas]MBB6288665.1 hypothetical protein [Pseudomonas sp. SJZ073]MBB6313637.1 hypothetical protein [Pseudomonas sp. JAI120]
MKGILFIALATLVTGASAAESILVTAELTRNGELVDKFSGYTMDRATLSYRNVQTISYKKASDQGKVAVDNLEVGTVGFVTPAIMSDGKILIRYKVNYVRLLEMNASKVGKLQIDLPHTEVFQISNETTVADGETFQIPENKSNGSKYIYKVSATKQ